MDLQSKLKLIGTAVAAVVPNAKHYRRPQGPPPFCVWSENGENGFQADNRKAQQAITGTLDYFTQTEYDPIVDNIQSMLDGLRMAWSLNSVQYEEDTELIHYEWEWEYT